VKKRDTVQRERKGGKIFERKRERETGREGEGGESIKSDF